MVTFNLLSIFLLLSVFLFSSCDILAKADDDFLECLSHQMNMNSSSISQLIYTPNNSPYSTLLKSYGGNPRLTLSSDANKPSFIFTPLDESQIQAVVRCSRIHGIQITIRSGGHDNEGLSYIGETPFVVVDLTNLRSISIDTSTKTAWVQAGAILGELYHSIATASRTLAFSAGICTNVGVGGQFSGGGYSMLSRTFGLACDNIIDATIIDAEGRLLDRESMGEDLFWAIRGGGGASFGIIVSWKIKLVDIPEKVTVFTVKLTLGQNATQIFHRWQHVAPKVDSKLNIRVFISTYEKSASPDLLFSFTALYVGDTKQVLNVMQKNFPELGLSKEDCIEMSWIRSILYFANYPEGASIDDMLKRGEKVPEGRPPLYFKGKSDFVQHIISSDGVNGMCKLMLDEADDFPTGLEFSPFGGKISEYSDSETPFPHRSGIKFMIHYGIGSRENKYGSLGEYMTRFVSKSPRRAYINYRDNDLGVNNGINTSYAQASIWGKRYFNNNFRRLVQVKTKVDPSNFFRSMQSIPSLSNQKPSVIQQRPKIPFSKNYF